MEDVLMEIVKERLDEKVNKREQETGRKQRLEILSTGKLPPKQTLEGFYAGESIPVNPELSKIFIQLHITEHTGRGVPKIVEVYGKDCIRLNENSINVTIPYNILEKDNYVPDDALINNEFDLNAPVNNTEKIILNMCVETKSILEIAEYLGYKDKNRN